MRLLLSLVFLATNVKKGLLTLLRAQAFQRGVTRRNLSRDDDARSKSLEEKPPNPVGEPYCTSYAASHRSVLETSFDLSEEKRHAVRRDSSHPASEDLAWMSNQEEPVRFFMRTIPAVEHRGDRCHNSTKISCRSCL